MTDRNIVYAVIDGERNYQDQRWGGQAHDRSHSVTEWLVYMKDYIDEALHACSRKSDAEAFPEALHIVRKVAAMGVACMEVHGAPARPGFEPADHRQARSGMKL